MEFLKKHPLLETIADSLSYIVTGKTFSEREFEKGKSERLKNRLGLKKGEGIEDKVTKHLKVKEHESYDGKFKYKVLHVNGGEKFDPDYIQGFCLGYSDKDNAKQNLSLIDRLSKYIPYLPDFMKGPIFKGVMDYFYAQSSDIPKSQKSLIEGFSDGSGIELRRMQHLLNLPRFMYACTSCAVSGELTDDKGMKVLRRLDLGPESGFHNYPLGIVFHNSDRNSYFISTFSGVPFALAGLNDKGIVITQVGEKTKNVRGMTDGRGTSLFSTLTEILENASNLEDAKEIMKNNITRIGYNGVIADTKSNEAFSYEIMPDSDKNGICNYVHFFKPNDEYEIARKNLATDPAHPIEGVCVRSSIPFDDRIREFNIERGDPERYYGIVNTLDPKNLGKVQEIVTDELMFKVQNNSGESDNMMDVLVTKGTVYMWYAKGVPPNFIPACKTSYVKIDREELFKW